MVNPLYCSAHPRAAALSALSLGSISRPSRLSRRKDTIQSITHFPQHWRRSRIRTPPGPASPHVRSYGHSHRTRTHTSAHFGSDNHIQLNRMLHQKKTEQIGYELAERRELHAVSCTSSTLTGSCGRAQPHDRSHRNDALRFTTGTFLHVWGNCGAGRVGRREIYNWGRETRAWKPR